MRVLYFRWKFNILGASLVFWVKVLYFGWKSCILVASLVSTGLRPPRHRALTSHQPLRYFRLALLWTALSWQPSFSLLCGVCCFLLLLLPTAGADKNERNLPKKDQKTAKRFQNWPEMLQKSRLGGSWGALGGHPGSKTGSDSKNHQKH